MDNESCYEADLFDEENLTQERKTKGKTRQRKWREIENIKEQRRLRRDLAEYEYAHY